jgi:hypothetical protein
MRVLRHDHGVEKVTPLRLTARAALARGTGLGNLVILVALIALAGCRASEPDATPSELGIDLSLDVVPLILRADTTEVATVWVTILEDGLPIADSTRVDLVATLGQVTAESFTHDGLAVATYRAAGETGSAAIIAQAKGVRDSIAVTLY